MQTLTTRESALYCAEQLYKRPARAEFRVARQNMGAGPAQPGPAGHEETLVLIAVYNAEGHRAEPRVVTLQQRYQWSNELARHASDLASATGADLTGPLAGFTVHLV